MDWQSYYHQAVCRCQAGEYTQAAADLENALNAAADLNYAGKRQIYRLLWLVYGANLDYGRMEGLFRMLLDAGEDKKDILGQLVHVYDKSGKWDRMARVLDEFRGVDLDAAPSLSRISCFTATGRIKDAFHAAREYAARFGEDKDVCARLMVLYYRAGAPARGFGYYKKAVAKSDDPGWRLNVGSMMLGEDLYDGAICDAEFPAIIGDMRRSSGKLQVDRSFDNTPKPFRKIRLGYLSADLRPHPVGYFLMPVMAKAEPCHSFIKCYSLFSPRVSGIGGKSITAGFRTMPDAWADVQGMPDEHIERMFLDDKIDIAFDMMCHSEGNRLRLYARRLAPVQISWIGFPVTTAVAAMDYVIADRHTNPHGAEKYYTEKLLYMPGHYLCHAPGEAPLIDPPAFTRNGYITFACFHNFRKITDATLDLWRRVLERTGNSVLKLMGKPPKGEDGRVMTEERFRKSGIPPGRISILQECKFEDYLAAYNGVDIMLDTYPFTGATTTFDALKMGRPVITLAGERHVARVSYSILKQIGFEELAAFTEGEYVEKAVALANDPGRLCRISSELPGRLMDSPLADLHAFRKNYEKIIRDAWVAYCAGKCADYDYGGDSLPELREQVANADAWFKRKLELGEDPDGAMVNEYGRLRKAFHEKKGVS